MARHDPEAFMLGLMDFLAVQLALLAKRDPAEGEREMQWVIASLKTRRPERVYVWSWGIVFAKFTVALG